MVSKAVLRVVMKCGCDSAHYHMTGQMQVFDGVNSIRNDLGK